MVDRAGRSNGAVFWWHKLEQHGKVVEKNVIGNHTFFRVEGY
jgi:hypothetical protein